MRKLVSVFFAVAFVFGMLGSANAIMYSGSLSYPPSTGGLVANGDWLDGVSLGWVVTQTADGKWSYTYTFQDTAGQAKDLSHIIVELSDSFTANDIVSLTYGAGNDGEFTIGTFSDSSGASNEGMPGALYGIKVNRKGSTTNNPFVFTLVTPKAPVWGDFYAKDGDTQVTLPDGTKQNVTNYVYNAGFSNPDPLDAPANGTIGYHILRPDTQTAIPEPGTILLLGSGFAVLGLWSGKRRNNNKKV